MNKRDKDLKGKLKKLTREQIEDLAHSPLTSGDDLDVISRFKYPFVKKLVVTNPNVLEKTLLRFSGLKENYLLNAIVDHPKVNRKMLMKMINNYNRDDSSILYRIACVSTDDVVLAYLSSSKNCFIRAAVARNDNCSINTVLSLSKDDNFLVRRDLIDNEKTPKHILNQLILQHDMFQSF